MDRSNTIIRTSIIGILANIMLAVFKAAVGMLANSIAIVMDAVNNLSDALSSVITIIGTKLAGKPADRKHPFGFGRIEYMSAMIISILVLYAGITSLTESVKKILSPQVPDYSVFSLIIVASAVVVKILLGRYVKSVGEKVNSDSLVNSGADALNDAVISASTLVAALVWMFGHISLEAWLAAVISVLIIKSGAEMLGSTISQVLGQGAEASYLKEIKRTVSSVPGVLGAFDLTLHDYGPDRYLGSVHVSVPDTMTADQLDKLTREITDEVMQKHDVILTAVGFYAQNTKNDAAAEALGRIRTAVLSEPYVLSMHGFFIDMEKKQIRFDIVVDYEVADPSLTHEQVLNKCAEEFPGYDIRIGIDRDLGNE
ncbi:MAG: cation transporter [Solobacterium sp.]|nr:cation transporter [Erysipelotrichaceae bacterium]MBQ1445907.1 cation transporter [Solobacterium sp.]